MLFFIYRCLLAALTYDHRLIIVGNKRNSWKELFDVSTLWQEWLEKNNWLEENLKENPSKLDQHVYRSNLLSITGK